jgi:hypothetical protein
MLQFWSKRGLQHGKLRKWRRQHQLVCAWRTVMSEVRCVQPTTAKDRERTSGAAIPTGEVAYGYGRTQFNQREATCWRYHSRARSTVIHWAIDRVRTCRPFAPDRDFISFAVCSGTSEDQYSTPRITASGTQEKASGFIIPRRATKYQHETPTRQIRCARMPWIPDR